MASALRPCKRRRTLKEEEERWSQLPTLLIWMVKDCLNLSDNARLSLVCKNWNSACRDYKPRPRNHPALPWIIHMNPKTTSTELVNFSNMEKIVLHTPQLQSKFRFLFSRRGWLLLLPQGEKSVLLYNLLNNVNVKIEILEFVQSWERILGSFSLKYDDLNPNPHHLAFVNFSDPVLTLLMIDVGSRKCTKYQYEIERSGEYNKYGASLRVVENHVYVLDTLGTTYIFDMMTEKWKEIAPLDDGYGYEMRRMTETQVGEILQIVPCYTSETQSFKIYKLDDNKTCWEELHDPNMNWFMSLAGHQRIDNLDLVVKDLSSGRKKAYLLDGWKENYMDMVGNHGSIRKQAISVRNIGEKQSMIGDDEHCWSFVMDDIDFDIRYEEVSTNVEVKEVDVDVDNKYVEWFQCSTIGPYSLNYLETHWIDLGWMDKVPPSCIGTKIPSCTHSL